LLPLTYFNEISRGVMLRAEPIGPLWQPFVFLGLLGLVVVTLATLRFRRYLAPAQSRSQRRRRHVAAEDLAALAAVAPAVLAPEVAAEPDVAQPGYGPRP
jgi:hypothetical protein